jgi:hypothetical protein
MRELSDYCYQQSHVNDILLSAKNEHYYDSKYYCMSCRFPRVISMPRVIKCTMDKKDDDEKKDSILMLNLYKILIEQQRRFIKKLAMKTQEQLKDEFLKSAAGIRKYERKASMNVEVLRKMQKGFY